MKPLNKMDNVDRGRLLADLLPLELSKIIQYIETEAQQMSEHEQFIRTHWAEGLCTADFWFSLVQNVDRKIKKCGSRLHTKHGWFADQLFDGYDALFTLYCLQEFATKTECSEQLTLAIHLIFGRARLILTNSDQLNKN
jgi:hypothetical protein